MSRHLVRLKYILHSTMHFLGNSWSYYIFATLNCYWNIRYTLNSIHTLCMISGIIANSQQSLSKTVHRAISSNSAERPLEQRSKKLRIQQASEPLLLHPQCNGHLAKK